MNGHDRRAPFYRSEFAVRDDFPLLRRLPARVIGMGFRPEHITH